MTPTATVMLPRPRVFAIAGHPGVLVAALILVCLVKGLLATSGVVVPPDPDTVRDLGFIQGFLDGNWTGDPVTLGAYRWYPPLVHALAALVIGTLHLPLLPTWLQAGTWLNLLSPLTFYLMNRRMTGAWPAVAATAILVLLDSAALPGDATAGYTPWTLTPALALPLFFSSVWLIMARVQRQSVTDAVLIGSALGLVFLVHTVPAVLLSCIVTAAALSGTGPTWRKLVWLTGVGCVQLAWAMPFLWPLITAYHLRILNPVPGSWVHPLLTDPIVLLPNLIGFAALVWLVICGHQRGTVLAVLAAWAGTCVAFLLRHYACATVNEAGGACSIFVVAAHHWHVYLQAAWACAGGAALVRIWRTRWAPLIMAGGVAGLIGFFAKPEDIELHRLGSTRPELIMDRAAYDWILAETRPNDLFVTELPPGGVDMGPAAASVIAAGRKLVAAPEFHSNPYILWKPRNALRSSSLAPDADFCGLVLDAASNHAFFMLPAAEPRPGLVPVFAGTFHSIYRVPACARALREGGKNLIQRLDLVSAGR